jgi:hypothetical protein
MIISLGEQELKHFKTNSLWIIMDPVDNQHNYTGQEGSMKMFDKVNLTAWNRPYLDKIIQAKASLPNCIIATGDIASSPLAFQNSLWISHSNRHALDIVTNYAKERQVKQIVFCGFHEQACILHRDLGYIKMSAMFDCFIFLDLVCPYPTPEWRREIKTQRNSDIYKYITLVG